ncbi:DUF2147 domain-containing protein [Rhodopseudomonas palustris]|uniref:DUF2147 domain-containing protein n=1 Tax=Rhodopseudomonas palustris TaxID=1076 RepID=UPI000E5BAA29|nr:DUF2147 domain-containing protein [Rhodopseudomonas palustris]QLH72846.1 DUF2147 domain-containing protein [Rhodopseudomonas palustris]RHZ99907.1 DUF2147 domain-containing protein [Rhodopseudomonas palustris]
MRQLLIGRRAFGAAVLAVLGAAMSGTAVRADDVAGTWLRETGASKVKFAPCGGAVCGTLVWLKPGVETPAKLGQKIFFDMKPTGPDAWAGSAFNPEDGKTYIGKMNLSGGTLTTQGCAMGGLICKSATWTRAN